MKQAHTQCTLPAEMELWFRNTQGFCLWSTEGPPQADPGLFLGLAVASLGALVKSGGVFIPQLKTKRGYLNVDDSI